MLYKPEPYLSVQFETEGKTNDATAIGSLVPAIQTLQVAQRAVRAYAEVPRSQTLRMIFSACVRLRNEMMNVPSTTSSTDTPET